MAPKDTVNDDSVIINKILFKTGDKVKADELVAEIETSKALVEISCQESGYIKCLCKENQEVAIGKKLFEIDSEKIEKDKKLNTDKINIGNEDKKADKILDENKEGTTKFSSEAEKFIKTNSIDIKLFDKLNFVTVKEIKKLLNNDLNPEETTKKNKLNPNLKLVSNEIKLDKQKINEIKYLSNVNSSGMVSRLTIFINATLKKIKENNNFITSTPLPLVAYEVSRLLLKYPVFNTYFHENKKLEHKAINIGVAFDNGVNGLKVASLFDCDKKDMLTIEENISELSLKYNKNKLSIKEISSASFTITDLFSSGVSNFHPLINMENSAILGICGVLGEGFNIEFSFDHRISNGLEASKFLNDLKYRLESRYHDKNLLQNETDIDEIKCYKCFRKINEDLGGEINFFKSINSDNSGYICSICLEGW